MPNEYQIYKRLFLFSLYTWLILALLLPIVGLAPVANLAIAEVEVIYIYTYIYTYINRDQDNSLSF
jgi:hypothetical protein